MPEPAWKRAERDECKRLGIQKLGGYRKDLPDGIDDNIVVEIKHSKNFPKWITDILDEAQVKAKEFQQKDGKDRKPLGILKRKGRPNSIVLMWGSDWSDWYGKLKA
jgi:hypothetical protein